MSSASSSSARSLFVESKTRLADRVQINVNNVASVIRQLQRGSRSNELLMQSAKQFVHQEKAIDNTETNIKKLPLVLTHLDCQLKSIDENLQQLQNISKKVDKLVSSIKCL